MKHTDPFSSISRLAAMGAVVLATSIGSSARAQSFVPKAQLAAAASNSNSSTYRPSIGEKATYDVELKGRGVGSGTLAIVGREMVDGHATMHASLKLEAGLLLMRYNEKLDTWFDPDRFFSRHFEQNQRLIGTSRQKNYLISPEHKVARETYGNTVDSLNTDEPLDDISFLYYARTLPLRVGDVDSIPRYFKSGHDVVLRVLRKETVVVPAGKFQTIVVQPTITNAGGLFGQGGKAEVYLSDDADRVVVMIKSSVPVIGSLSLTLRELTAP